jgi:hypothetical protein
METNLGRIYVFSSWDYEPSEISWFKDGALGTCISQKKLEEFGVDIELFDYIIADKGSIVVYRDQTELTTVPYTQEKFRERKVYVEKLHELLSYLKDLINRKKSLCPRQS